MSRLGVDCPGDRRSGQAPQDRPRTPQSTFDIVAPYYDVINSALSLRRDRYWRRRAAEALRLPPRARVLDVATGTASLALQIAEGAPSGSLIVGCDVNEKMLRVAARRLAIRPPTTPVCLVLCDAVRLPFADASFDAVSIAFAIDDVEDRDECAREMRRVLKPEGQIALVELAQPDHAWLRALYARYLRVLPALSRVSSRAAYGHLREEILTYRGPEAIAALLRRAGFEGYHHTSLTGGIARLHVARAPARRS